MLKTEAPGNHTEIGRYGGGASGKGKLIEMGLRGDQWVEGELFFPGDCRIMEGFFWDTSRRGDTGRA